MDDNNLNFIMTSKSFKDRNKTPKFLLQELARQNKLKCKFTLIKEEGAPHLKKFTVSLNFDDELFIGTGLKIKQAEQQAAANALSHSTACQRSKNGGTGVSVNQNQSEDLLILKSVGKEETCVKRKDGNDADMKSSEKKRRMYSRNEDLLILKSVGKEETCVKRKDGNDADMKSSEKKRRMCSRNEEGDEMVCSIKGGDSDDGFQYRDLLSSPKDRRTKMTEAICTSFGLKDVDISHLADTDFTSFNEFIENITPALEEKNAEVPQGHLLILTAAKWRDYLERKSSAERLSIPKDEESIVCCSSKGESSKVIKVKDAKASIIPSRLQDDERALTLTDKVESLTELSESNQTLINYLFEIVASLKATVDQQNQTIDYIVACSEIEFCMKEKKIKSWTELPENLQNEYHFFMKMRGSRVHLNMKKQPAIYSCE